MFLPQMPVQYTERNVTDSFYGYKHRDRLADGEFYDTENLSTDAYPLLSCRARRGLVKKSGSLQGIIEFAEKLAVVEDGKLFFDTQATGIEGLSEGDKQLVSIGGYICVFPDKVYYNTADPQDRGSMEAEYTSTGNVVYKLCKSDGSYYEKEPAAADTAPQNPADGDLWIDTSVGKGQLLIYSAALVQWSTIQEVYTRIQFVSNGELPGLFKEYDGVEISGSDLDEINGAKVLYAVGGDESTQDYVVVAGLLPQAHTQSTGFVKLARKVPDMDFVCESQNRLWGCYYGRSDKGTLNEIYCCALGDFKNWRQYMGLASDSWTASVGADGEWTGAVNYLGSPLFFKEGSLHKVTVSAQGAHRINETVCRGVQPGSHKSLQVVNETLYYKARGDVCAYQGGFPVSVSEALGDEKYANAAAGALPDRYYIAMDDSEGRRWLFVYDLKRGLWMKEDRVSFRGFARAGAELYAIGDGGLFALLGSEGEKEPYVKWGFKTGMLYYQYPDKKYVSRFNLRLSMEEGAEMDLYIMYDSDGVWRRQGRVAYKGTGTVTVPVWPRRCDHMHIKAEGKGCFKLYSIARILEVGSDA